MADGYELLIAAIIQQAIQDYRVALKDNTRAGAARATSLERFFLSEWGQLLSLGNGELIVSRVKAEKNNPIKRSGKSRIGSRSLGVVVYTDDGEFVGEYDTIVDASDILGVSITSISKCCRTRGKTCGYIFRYKVRKGNKNG